MADVTLSLHHTIYNHCHVVYCHYRQLRLLTKPTHNLLLGFKDLLNNIPAKLIYHLLFISSPSQPHIHLRCFLLSNLCQQLLYIFTGVSNFQCWSSTRLHDPILDLLRTRKYILFKLPNVTLNFQSLLPYAVSFTCFFKHKVCPPI